MTGCVNENDLDPALRRLTRCNGTVSAGRLTVAAGRRLACVEPVREGVEVVPGRAGALGATMHAAAAFSSHRRRAARRTVPGFRAAACTRHHGTGAALMGRLPRIKRTSRAASGRQATPGRDRRAAGPRRLPVIRRNLLGGVR